MVSIPPKGGRRGPAGCWRLLPRNSRGQKPNTARRRLRSDAVGGDPDDMARAALAVGARVDLLDGEARLFQPPREAAVRPLRPHRQHAARLKGGACGAEAREAVESVIAL